MGEKSPQGTDMQAVSYRKSAMFSRQNNAALHQAVQCSTSQLLLLLAASAAQRGDSAVSEMNGSLKSYRVYVRVPAGPQCFSVKCSNGTNAHLFKLIKMFP